MNTILYQYPTEAVAAFKESFWTLLIREPHGRITVKSLASKAGYCRNTFYHYYSGFDDLRIEIENEIIASIDGILTEVLFTTYDYYPNTDIITKMFERMVRYLAGPYCSDRFTNKLDSQIKGFLENAYSDMFIQDSLDVKLMAQYHTAGIISAAKYIFDCEPDAASELPNILSSMLPKRNPTHLRILGLDMRAHSVN